MKLSALFVLFFSASVMGFGQPDKLAAKSQTAREAMSEGRFVDAIPIYQELIKALPGQPGLKMNLGIAHYMAGQYRESIRQLDPVVRTNPELTEALLFLGASQHQVGNPAGAVPPLRRYVQKKSGDPRGRQLLGESLFAIQRFEEAAAQFEALGKLEPENPKAWYGLGRSYEGLAARAFERLEKLSPESAYGFALIAATRAAQNQYRSAFFFYRKALEKQPKMRGVHVALSQVYRKAGHPEWAAQEEQKEIELGLPDCVAERIVCDFLAGRFKEVLDAAKREQTPQSYYWRSQAYNQLALDSLSRLAQLLPSFELHEVMAEIYRNQGRHVESIREWKKALALSPDNPLARKELAVSLLLTQDYGTAKPLVESLLKENPRSAQLNYLAGDILLNQQRPVDAVPFLRKAVEYDPGLSPAHASLGRAYITFGEAAKAIPHLKSALVLDQDGSLHYQLARAYRSTGALELAGQMLQKYQQIQKSAQEEKERLEEEARITPPQ